MPIIDDFFSKDLEKRFQAFITFASKLKDEFKELLKITDKIAQSNEDNATKQKKLNELEKEAAKKAKEREVLNKKILATKTALNTQRKKEIDAQAKLTTAYKKEQISKQLLNKEQKQSIILDSAKKGSIVAISAALSINIAKWKALSAQERDNTTAGKKLTDTIKRQELALQNLDSRIGRSQRHVGDYARGMANIGRSLIGAFGVVGGMQLFAKVVKDSFAIVTKFNDKAAELAGVLKTDAEGIKALTDNAIELNKTMPTTANEILEVELALARLGNTQDQIIASTKGIINTSIALKSPMEDVAELGGAVAKAYDIIEEQQFDKVMNQITDATLNSSLNFEKLKTALPKVASAGAALNIPLSEILSNLATIQDATLDASITGTSYRNILLELSKSGMSLNEALDDINDSQDKVNRANELFGKRASISAVALAENRDRSSELAEQFENVGDVVDVLASKQLETLTGKVKLLSSSWEGLVLQLKNGDALSELAAAATIILDQIGGMSAIDSIIKRYTPALVLARDEYLKLDDGLKSVITEHEYLAERLKELGEGQEAASSIANGYIESLNKQRTAVNEFAGKSLPELQAELVKLTLLSEEFEGQSTASTIALQDQMQELEGYINRLQSAGDVLSEEIPIEKTYIGRISGVDQSGEVLSEVERVEQEIRDKNRVTIDSILNGKIKLKDINSDAYNNALELATLEEEANQKKVDAIVKMEQDANEQIKQSKQNLYSQIEESGKKIIVDQFNAQVNNNLEAVRSASEAELNIQKDKLDKGQISEKQYAKNVAKINKEQRIAEAKANKKSALFDIAINTAVAVAKVLAQTGVLAPATIPFILGLGAVQSAAVLAAPLPAFKDGGLFARGGLAETGEVGTELAIGANGKAELTKPYSNIRHWEPGTTFIPHDKTVEMLSLAKGGNEALSTNYALSRIEKAIVNQPQSSTVADVNSVVVERLKGSNREIRRKKYYS